MSARNYGQACSVAGFLDEFAARWTLLIVRDLLIGPRRFTQLLEGLAGIGANRLTERLRWLTEMGIVEKDFDTHEHPRYVLSEKGAELEPVVLSMARWGLRHIEYNAPGKVSRADLLVVAFRAAFKPELAAGIDETYEFRIDSTTFFVEISGQRLTTDLGPASCPEFVFTSDSETFNKLVSREMSAKKAHKNRLVHFVGDWVAYARFEKMFGGIVS